MNAQKLWKGSDYAMGYKRKGATDFPINATRVKVLDIIKKPIYGRERDRTYVTVMLLNDEGMPPDINNPVKQEVVTRDILDFWDEYLETVGYDEREEWLEKEAERKRRRAEEKRQQEERTAVYWIGNFLRGVQRNWERNEEIRIRHEEEKKRVARTLRMKNVLITRGFNAEDFYVSDGRISFSMQAMERWLGFEEAQ